jgi:general stress protein 13
MIKVGQVVVGRVSGIQPYGAFVEIDEQTSGLIHISEMSDYFVKDISLYVQVNDQVYLKVLEVSEDGRQLKLSLKAVYQRPLRRFRARDLNQRLPQGNIGFKSLAEKLPEWIQSWKGKYHD